MNSRKVKRVVSTWDKQGLRINIFFSALYSSTDSCHGGSIVVCLASTHHYVQAIIMSKLKVIEKRLSNFVCLFSVQEKEISFICISLLFSIMAYLTIKVFDQYEKRQEYCRVKLRNTLLSLSPPE